MNSHVMPMPVSASLAYPFDINSRDLRIDFMRGLVMLVVITVHMEYYSIFGILVWEKIGFVSSAEGFVFLSGLVLGIVCRKRIVKEGLWSASKKLWQRSLQLYRVNVVVTLSIALLGILPFIDVYEVTHWVNPVARDQALMLYPPASATWLEIVIKALFLQIGPHQFQVIGLYVILIALAPVILFLLYKKQTPALLLFSWSVYLVNQLQNLHLTGAQFEYAFPVLTWQLLFINGMAIGFHRHIILGYITNKPRYLLLISMIVASLLFMFVALNSPKALFWPWQPWSYIDADIYGVIYDTWFQKSLLGFGRIVNNVVLFILFYYLLSHYWQVFAKTLGWLLIPLGQASLYVFIVHIYFILLFSNTTLPAYNNFYINTFMHSATIFLIWAMVKHRVLFKLIPR